MQTTHQHHGNEADLISDPEPVEGAIDVQTTVDGISTLIVERESLEHYRNLLQTAGKDGLDPLAKAILQINLNQFKSIGLESFGEDHITVESISESIGKITEKIKAYIEKIIALAKEQYRKYSAGFEKTSKDSEALIKRIKAITPHVSKELYDDRNKVTIDNPSILFADGNFEPSLTKVEKDVIKFFTDSYKRYLVEQTNKVIELVKANDSDFEANVEFIGQHKSLVETIRQGILPGDYLVGFKHVALGPILIKDEEATTPPNSYEFEIRDVTEITNALKNNITEMQNLSSMFKAESEILNAISDLGKAVLALESNRNSSTDKISLSVMDLITKLNPNYDPIVRHLSRIGVARNEVCRKELDTLDK